MKSQTIRITLAAWLFFTLQASVALPETTDSYESTLLLNGTEVNTAQFSHVVRGVISLAKGGSDRKSLVPFHIYLKRHGRIINAEGYSHNFAVQQWEIADILKWAEPGDQIIIDPTEPRNAAGRKVITVKKTQILPQFQWFFGVKSKKDNC
ncbi:hypothetical protein SAMN04487996_108154 [Dyadobacter soli]|uniref:Uncharacterized protein n=1 Tax=Dyadobacter soli TaxID=659014 RepID=A0A1G7HGF4_9BACT|nr:hypothetical protein [Dyadobacter soli]SDE99570.1 hypothetical protein SAMN04487996_108154 [Dyadobacter soli]